MEPTSLATATDRSSILSKDAVCKRLDISARCLENMVTAKRFPRGVKIGKAAFWSVSAVEEFLRREFAVQDSFWRSR